MLHGSESLLLSELETSVLTLAVALLVGTTFRVGALLPLPLLGFEPEPSDLITMSVEGRFLLLILLAVLLLILDLVLELDFLMDVGLDALDSGLVLDACAGFSGGGGSSSSSEESKRLLRDGFEDFFAKDGLDEFELAL